MPANVVPSEEEEVAPEPISDHAVHVPSGVATFPARASSTKGTVLIVTLSKVGVAEPFPESVASYCTQPSPLATEESAVRFPPLSMVQPLSAPPVQAIAVIEENTGSPEH